jgi:Tol biopolymer transport system component
VVGDRKGVDPRATTDGKYLLFSAPVDSTFDDYDLFRVALTDPDAKSEKIVDTPKWSWGGQVSPDSRWLAYMSDESGEFQVYLTPYPQGGGRWQVSVEGGGWPRWRGDSKELFFMGNDGIYTVTVDAEPALRISPPTRLITHVKVNAAPWQDHFDVSSDGQRFYLVAAAGDDSDARPNLVFVQNWVKEVGGGE